MSLLLDARKKSQGGSDGRPELALSIDTIAPPAAKNLTGAPLENARNVGQNLFRAKSSSSVGGQVNRNFIYALLGAVVLFGIGAAYVWYAISANDRPVIPVVQRPTSITPPPAPLVIEPAALPVIKPDEPVTAMANTPSLPDSKPVVAAAAPVAKKTTHPVPANLAINLAPDKSNSLDTLLNKAYQAYRGGQFEQAHGVYRDALVQDPRNTDALLGLAAIAQHQGADTLAAQYYSKVLALDPRNAVANAGISALTTDENRESHLKMLLNEQPDAPALHFALGNHYAAQARWGEAQQAYFNAYKLDPNNTSLAFNLAISLERLGQKKQSAPYYQRALQLDTGNSAGFDHAAIEQHAKQLAQ